MPFARATDGCVGQSQVPVTRITCM